MGLLEGFVYKVAQEPWEVEAVHALNGKTNAEETIYVVCVHEERRQLAGMLAFRDQRPFALENKLSNLDVHLPEGRSLCEVQLLVVEEEFRYTRISQGLIAHLVRHAMDCGYDLAIISGTIGQIKLYTYLGFIPFGPMVGAESAQCQPMYLTLEAYSELKGRYHSFCKETEELGNDDTMLFNFLSAPVDFLNSAKDVNKEKPSSCHSVAFMDDFQNVRRQLCELANTKQVQVMMGAGTLANDAVAAQLSLLCQTGLILVSGEFGNRLVNNANGAKLFFHTLEVAEGETFSCAEIETVLNKNPDIKWIWGTHCETSTGVLNDIEMYQQICDDRELKLCLDCISSLGTVPLDLSKVYLASASSGHGLATRSGLAMVFHNHDFEPAPDDVPSVLDLGLYQQADGLPFTVEPKLIHVLLDALNQYDWEQRYLEVRDWSKSIRRKLAEIDAPILAADSCAMPAVITIALPELHSSEAIGDVLKNQGVLISYRNDYLLERNWIQACMMGSEHKPTEKFVRLLKKELTR